MKARGSAQAASAVFPNRTPGDVALGNDEIRPMISVVIPARNEEDTLSKCLDSLEGLDYPKDRLEIIIIDDGSTDGTSKILKGYTVERIGTSGVGPSEARNIGVKKARGEFVVFTDADCIVHKEWLNGLLKGFVDDAVVGTGGRQESPADETAFGRSVQGFLKSMSFICDYTKTGAGIVKAEHNPTCNVMYRKAVLEEMGGFESGLWPGEDVELDYRIRRAGYNLMNNSNAIVYHYRPKDIRQFARMMHDYGRVQGYLVKKYGPFRSLHYVPGIVLMGGVLWLLLIAHDPATAAFIALAGFLASVLYVLAESGFRVGETITNYRLLLTTLLQWNAGFLKGIVRR